MSYSFIIQAIEGSKTYPTAREQLQAGGLAAYSLRSNGTERHWELVPLGTERRDTAEWIFDQVEEEGRSVEAVARELHVSNATVRRFLAVLELTEEIEAGEWDDIWAALLGFDLPIEGDGFDGAQERQEALEATPAS